MAVSTDPQSLLNSANKLQLIRDEDTALQVQIYLLQQLAGNTQTPQQLIDSTKQYQLIRDKATLRQIIIYLLAQAV